MGAIIVLGCIILTVFGIVSALRKHPVANIVVDAILIHLLALFAIVFIMYFSALFQYRSEPDDTMHEWNTCESFYHDRNFSALINHLNLYDLSAPEYDKYYEITKAYEDYQKVRIWKDACEAGVEDADRQLKTAAESLEADLKNCKFEENLFLIENWHEYTKGI